MNGFAIVALIAAALLAVGDWDSRLHDNAPLEYVCKPGTLTALIAVAVLLDPTDDGVRAWFVAALHDWSRSWPLSVRDPCL